MSSRKRQSYTGSDHDRKEVRVECCSTFLVKLTISAFCTFTDLCQNVCSQEGPSACLHDRTIFHSCTPSRMLYQLLWATSASPFWSIVSNSRSLGARRA